jgi:CRISPR-associated protein Csb2
MPLVLEIEHLLGVAFAAQSPASSEPDWPPQPDRVFSALVAAWGARGERASEREALLWLEAQAPPEITASDGFARTPATVYVPPNDPQTGRAANVAVMPSFRSRQPRRFPAYWPEDPVVRLVWRGVEVDEKTIEALNALAADTPYIGHSSSLTRCRFLIGSAPELTETPRRRVYPGRLAELEQGYHARPRRRPNPGADVPITIAAEPEPRRSLLCDRWLVLEHVGGEMPDLRAAALVAKAVRYVLMAGYRNNGQAAAIPSVVSGHAADGAPHAEPHLAIAPLAFLGTQYADGRVFAFALIPPGEGKLLHDPDFQSAVRAVAAWKEHKGRRELEVGCGGFNLTFTPSGEGALRSLDPQPYVAVAKTWATCTPPIVLDRHLKAKGNAQQDSEIAELLRHSCANMGLPEPTRIAAGRHSAILGAPPAFPSGRRPPWTRWRLPDSLASRQLVHAVLQFAEPVRGPVILGAGRFVGLGLCRGLDSERC